MKIDPNDVLEIKTVIGPSNSHETQNDYGQITNQSLIAEIARISANVGAKAALETMEKEKKRQQANKRDRRLRNTKILMRNYRDFKIHCQDSIPELEELKDPESLKYLDAEEFVIESIIKNKKRTLAMLGYIDRMLHIYQVLSEKSKKPEDLRRYKVLIEMYVSEDGKNIDAIAEGHSINKRTVFKDINKACETLSSLIFGVDGLRLID